MLAVPPWRMLAWTAVLLMAAAVAAGGVGVVAWGMAKRRRRWWGFGSALAGLAVLIAAGSATVMVLVVGRRVTGELAETATGVENRVSRFLTIDGDGCPRALPWDGPERRLLVFTCGGISFPGGAEVEHETTDYFLGEGEYVSALKVDAADAAAVLARPAPWESRWLDGPVPEPLPWFEYTKPFDDLHRSAKVRYVLIDLPDGLGENGDLSSGSLLAVHPTSGRVWFAYWDS